MEYGLFSVGDLWPDPITGKQPDVTDRIQGIARIAKHAEDIGLDVYAMGEHHNPPFMSSSPTTLLAYIAARTSTITLSTSTTLITTNDPVKIAEDYATLQHVAGSRVDLMLGRGNTGEVYPWFGKDIRDGIPLAIENYALLRRLWREENVDWTGKFRTPLHGFTSVPRPLGGIPPVVWHGSIRSPEIAEQAAYYGDGFFVNNLFMTEEYFKQFSDFYRQRFEHYGHGTQDQAIVGAGGMIYSRPNSQDAYREIAPYYYGNPVLSSTGKLEDAVKTTGLNVGSPAEVVEQILNTQAIFGTLQRQLFALEISGIPEKTVHEQLDLIGAEILPALRRETSLAK